MTRSRKLNTRPKPLRGPEFGSVLRQAREARGLSVREMAAVLGVSGPTVWKAEAASSPRYSTLRRYVDRAGLTAGELLGQPDHWPDPASEPLWRYLRDVAAYHVRRVVLHVGGSDPRLEIAALRVTGRGWLSDRGSLRSSVIRLAMMRIMALDASPDLLRELDARPSDLRWGRRVEQDDRYVHEWRFPKSLDQHGMSYTRRPIADADPEDEAPPVTALSLRWPTRRLEIVAERPRWSEHPPKLLIWPEGRGLDEDSEIARPLHPRGVTLRRTKTHARVALECPLPGLQYALTWRPTAARGARLRRPSWGWSIETIAREERDAADWSMRQAADAAGVSLGTWHDMEHGAQPRRDFLVGLLRAFPDLSPQELLPPGESGDSHDLDHDAAWESLTRLHGLVADEITKRVTVHVRGGSTCRIETKGLRSLRGSLQNVRVRAALQRAIVRTAPSVLQEIITDAASLTARTIRRTDGDVTHELRLPRRLAQAGLTYVRRYEAAGDYLSRREARRVAREAPESYEGVSLPVPLPVRVARLSITLPRALDTVRAHVWPAGAWPDADVPHMSQALELPKPSVRTVRPGVMSLSVKLERPVPGTWLALSWRMLT